MNFNIVGVFMEIILYICYVILEIKR